MIVDEWKKDRNVICVIDRDDDYSSNIDLNVAEHFTGKMFYLVNSSICCHEGGNILITKETNNMKSYRNI